MTPLPVLNKESLVAVLGAGRLGSSLAIALDKAGYIVAAITSRQPTHREWLNSHITTGIVVENVQTAVNVANIVFITGPDAYIEKICSGVKWRSHQAVIHCAGAMSLAPSSCLSLAPWLSLAPCLSVPCPSTPRTRGGSKPPDEILVEKGCASRF